MGRTAVNLCLGAHFHHHAQIHDQHPVAQVLDDPQIVGNEEIGQLELCLQILNQVHHLSLDGHVQGGHRLVADDELGMGGDGPGNADALPLAAGKFVGEPVVVIPAQPYLLHQAEDPLVQLFFILYALQTQGRGDDVIDLLPGVQAAVGILEDDLHILPVRAHPAVGQTGNFMALKGNASGSGRNQIQDDPTQGGFAAAGLAHQAYGLPLIDVKGNAVQSLHDSLFGKAGAHREFLPDVFYADQHFFLHMAHSFPKLSRKQRV